VRILVTGGAGFIGSHIAEAYLAQGHQVTVLDNLSKGKRENIPNGAEFIEGDIRDRKVRELLADLKIEVINHHAAQMDVRFSVADPLFDAEVNILGMLNLLEGARAAGVKQFIFASTGGAVYGEQEQFPAPEEHPLRPLSPYGITKLTGEKYLFYYNQVHGLNYFVLRYSNVYGPRQNPHGEAGVVAIFCNKMLAGEQPVINGDGTQTRDYVYVKDVVKANLAALGYPQPEVVNIGTAKETDVNTIFRVIRDAINPEIPEYHGPPKAGEQQRSVVAIEKAARVLNWKPEYSLEEGLAETVEWFKANYKG